MAVAAHAVVASSSYSQQMEVGDIDADEVGDADDGGGPHLPPPEPNVEEDEANR